MKQSDFEKQLKAIQEDANNRVANLVLALRETNADGWDGDKPVDFAGNGGNWEKTADAFAELAGFIHDRMNGRNQNERKSMTQKLRKALGYNVR
jgi:hypothetical protein